MLFGDVYVCGGQSNMQFSLGGNENKGRKGVARPQGNWRGRKNNLRRNDRRYRRRGRFGDQPVGTKVAAADADG